MAQAGGAITACRFFEISACVHRWDRYTEIKMATENTTAHDFNIELSDAQVDLLVDYFECEEHEVDSLLNEEIEFVMEQENTESPALAFLVILADAQGVDLTNNAEDPNQAAKGAAGALALAALFAARG